MSPRPAPPMSTASGEDGATVRGQQAARLAKQLEIDVTQLKCERDPLLG